MTRWVCGGGLALALVLSAVDPGRAAEPVAQPARAVVPADDAPYDATGRRDPFRPPHVASSMGHGGERPPLERYDIGQLRLVAVIYDAREPRAVVEDDAGLGYIVKIGTHIGPNGGQVENIQRGRVLVREDSVDFYGQHHPTDVTMELKTNEKFQTGERGKQ